MKHLLPLFSLSLIAMTSPTLAASSPVAPPDTVTGHARMVHILSAGLCTKLEAENKRHSLSDLTSHQLDKLTEAFTLSIIGENLEAFQALRKQVPTRKQHAYEERLGEEAIVDMVGSCAASKIFFPQIASQSIQDKSPISEAERAVLLPIAQAACQRLEDENTRQALSQRTAAEKQAVLVSSVQAPIMINAPELMKYYGDDILSDSKRAAVMGERMGLVMIDICPKYLLILGLGMNKK